MDAPIISSSLQNLNDDDSVDIVRFITGERWIEMSPASQHRVRLHWATPIQTVLLVKKQKSQKVTLLCTRVAAWLKEKQCRVLIERDDLIQKELYEPRLEIFSREMAAHVDLCVCIGGDGTLLHLNSLFQEAGVPPVVAFAMGTLSFLTHFEIDRYEACLTKILNFGHVQSIPVALRMRLMCRVFEPIDAGDQQSRGKLVKKMQVLNELVLDRGNSSYLLKVELYVDGEFVTLVKADGIIISTPTGSTAYSMSAGGSMVAPSVPAILITPTCPHSLSFRPAIIPDSSSITLRIPESLEFQASAGFDGRHLESLRPGSIIDICTSGFPMATIGFGGYNHDWFQSIKSKLNWNESTARSNL